MSEKNENFDTVETERVVENQVKETEEKESEKVQEKKYTDEDVNRIINKKFAEFKARNEKEKKEAEKLINMTAQEKYQYERDELQKQIDELNYKLNKTELEKVTRETLRNQNIVIGDDLLAHLITDKAETTKTNIDGFIKLFNEAVDVAVNERMKGKTPKSMNGVGNGITKEEIMKIQDPTARQQAIADNLELFE